jgi:hypothetical protein
VIPPCASSKALKYKRDKRESGHGQGPNKYVPAAVPVGCDELPVMEGSRKELSVNGKAADAAKALGSRDFLPFGA